MAQGDKYEQAILKGHLVYTLNGGWIDTKHANPKTSRGTLGVGAGSLWHQIVFETGSKSTYGGSKGFKVTYRQDALFTLVGVKFYPRVIKEYFVKCGLSVAAKESIALAIFQEVSMAFEAKQAMAKWSTSSFSIEDLVSNLLGFYTIVRPGKNYLQLCKPLTAQESLELYRRHQDTFARKNKKFRPVFFDYNQCGGGKFPSELQQIVPAKKGGNFRDWSLLDDITRLIPERQLKHSGSW